MPRSMKTLILVHASTGASWFVYIAPGYSIRSHADLEKRQALNQFTQRGDKCMTECEVSPIVSENVCDMACDRAWLCSGKVRQGGI